MGVRALTQDGVSMNSKKNDVQTSEQLHDRAQGWRRWASWGPQSLGSKLLQVGNLSNQDLQLNNHTMLLCLQRKGDGLIHLHNSSPTNM